MMPKLGLTMESGTILEWLVDDGADVEQGSAVLVIETDKVESEVEASGSGVLHIVGAKGDAYARGETIGWFLEPGEDAPVPVAPKPIAVAAAVASQVAPSGPAVAAASPGGRLFASPNARRVAAQRGVDLRRVTGSGPGGRIVSEDVVAAPVGADVPATPAARQLAEAVRTSLGGSGVEILGPAPAVFPRLKDRFRFQVLIKGTFGRKEKDWLAECLRSFKEEFRGVDVVHDVDPVSMY